MRRDFVPLCSRIALHLLGLLSMEGHRWDLPFLAFLVEVLECLDLRDCADSILEIMSRHLRNECRERRRLALRGLVVLSKDPSMARRMGTVSQRLVDVLGDADGEVVRMSLSVFMNVLQYKNILVMDLVVDEGKKPLKRIVSQSLLPLFLHCHEENQRVAEASMKTLHCATGFLKKRGLKQLVKKEKLPKFGKCLGWPGGT
ncbi:uncharacterized protein LOC135309384 isoform X3 [Passer domesticus]|uniref:uncharacterized protein LOC135309384 isoform X3 n=1 Tax=Passer domesticus TaxID=48849 RepID=UPI0030FE06D3